MDSVPSVLIIEGNEGHSFLIEEKFRSAFPKAEILLAHTLREAIPLLSRKRLDLVVVNAFLPDGKGTDFVDQLTAKHPYTAVAILTEELDETSNDELIDHTKNHMAVEFLTKDRQTLDSFVVHMKRLLATSKRIRHLLYGELKAPSGPLFRDPMTGVYSRSYFEESLQREMSRANRYDQEFSILIADIDHFKLINNQKGPPEGDSYLKKLSSVLVRSVRAGDIVARYGADEFIVLLSQCRKSDSVRCAARVLERLNKRTGEHRFTVSIGILHYQKAQKIHQIEEIVSRVEQALTRAKRQGGDRFTVAA